MTSLSIASSSAQSISALSGSTISIKDGSLTTWLTVTPAAASAITVDKAATSFTLSQTARSTDASCASISIAPQAAYASATGSNRQPGSLNINMSNPTNSGTTNAKISLFWGINELLNFKPTTAGAGHIQLNGYGSIYLNGGTVDTSGNCIFSSGSSGAVFSTSDTFYMRSVNTSTRITWTVSAAPVAQVDAACTSFSINFADKTTNSGTGAPLNITAQNETGTTSTGGALNLASGTGTTTAGAVNIKAGSTTRISVNGTGIGFYGTSPIAQQTGVGVDAASIHAALVSLGLITA